VLRGGLMLPAVHLLLATIGFDRTLRLLGRWSSGPSTSRAVPEQPKRVAQLLRASGNAGLHPRNCLRESLVLWFLLRRKGFQPNLRLGVRREEAGDLEAHAWVELAGEVLNDDPDVGQRFIPLQEPLA